MVKVYKKAPMGDTDPNLLDVGGEKWAEVFDGPADDALSVVLTSNEDFIIERDGSRYKVQVSAL